MSRDSQSPLARQTTLAVRGYLCILAGAATLLAVYYLLTHLKVIAPPGSTISKGNWFLIEPEAWVTQESQWRPTLHLSIIWGLVSTPFWAACRAPKTRKGWKLASIVLLSSAITVCLSPFSIGLWALFRMPDVKTAWNAWEE